MGYSHRGRSSVEDKEQLLNRVMAAREGARSLGRTSTALKNRALSDMAELLVERAEQLISENAEDVAQARQKGLTPALIDRLTLTRARIADMAEGLREVARLPDPVGEVTKMWQRPNGMTVGRMRVPIGVIGIIYESRPNVTAEAASLCIKAGNAVVLRGGSEALRSNRCIAAAMRESLRKAGIHEGAVTFIDIPGHRTILDMVTLEGMIDLIIPRGGEGLIRTVTEHARIPVLKHYKGVCHVYVDRDADLRMAEEISFNAKVQRPGTCNAMETLLVDEAVAEGFLPGMLRRFADSGVELRACPRTLSLHPNFRAVTEEDFTREYLDLILNVKIVEGIDDAMAHIARYGSAHSDAIVTMNHERAMRFLREVDSSAVFINASTRLNDGFQFGLGAEIGISTDKIHARGPMGLEELTCTKFIVFGNGQLRE
jgi:glutamate-5-semialdehyde dehydrogenase